MFRIIGDEIEYEYHVIGRLTAPTFDTWRNRAVELLEDMNPDRVERERDKAINEIEQEYEDEIAALEMRIEDLETEKKRAESLLDAIDDGMTALELIENYRKEAADWKKLAEDNRNLYLGATQRKRRVARRTIKE